MIREMSRAQFKDRKYVKDLTQMLLNSSRSVNYGKLCALMWTYG